MFGGEGGKAERIKKWRGGWKKGKRVREENTWMVRREGGKREGRAG